MLGDLSSKWLVFKRPLLAGFGRPLTGAGRGVGGVPSLRVGDGQPAHELRQVAVGSRPEHQVPVVSTTTKFWLKKTHAASRWLLSGHLVKEGVTEWMPSGLSR